MNCKKYMSLLLVLVLLVSNTGMAFNVHYCGGLVTSVSLESGFRAQAQKDCCGKAIQKSHCCKNKVVHFEKRSDNNLVKLFAFQSVAAIRVVLWQPIAFTSVSPFKKQTSASYYCDANAPPLFKLFSQYLFYDTI